MLESIYQVPLYWIILRLKIVVFTVVLVIVFTVKLMLFYCVFQIIYLNVIFYECICFYLTVSESDIIKLFNQSIFKSNTLYNLVPNIFTHRYIHIAYIHVECLKYFIHFCFIKHLYLNFARRYLEIWSMFSAEAYQFSIQMILIS